MSTKTKESKINKIPKLRFPEFHKDWENILLGNVVTFHKGKGISKSEIAKDGRNKCIRYGELYTTYKEVISEVISRTNIQEKYSFSSKRNDVLIPSSGETSIDIATTSCVMEDGVFLGGDLNVMRPLEKQHGIFLAYYLSNFQKINVARLAQGHTVSHLYSSQLKNLKLHLPTFPEQQKIADFLSTTDNWIQNLRLQKESLETYKKGMMQKIFSQEIRFKDNNGNDFPDWEEKSLGNLGKFRSGQGFSNKEQEGNKGIPFYKVSDMNTLGNEIVMKSANHYVTQKQIKRLGYKVITDKSIIFAKVGAAIFLERKRIAGNFLLDNNMMAFTPKGNIEFMKHLFSTIRLSKFAQVGALPSYNVSDISIIKKFISVSTLEQQKIAEFLTSIDNLLESKQKQIEKAEKWKKGLMQEIFV